MTAPSGNFLNCIVFSKLREDRAAWDKPRFTALRWPDSTRVVVLGQWNEQAKIERGSYIWGKWKGREADSA
jgi:hypothetical protein